MLSRVDKAGADAHDEGCMAADPTQPLQQLLSGIRGTAATSCSFARPQKKKNGNSNPSFSVLVFSVAATSLLISAMAQSLTEPAASRPFQPGVRIDWEQKAVEIDARVVLREGPLELFACSPQTKEHESIL